MYNDDSEPHQNAILSTSEQIRAFVHPVRLLILKMLSREKRTISSVAKEFGVHPANITHHFKRLERLGLIKLVEKRVNNKNIEKYYRAAAKNFRVKPGKVDESMASAALVLLRKNLGSAMHALKSHDPDKIIALLANARIRKKDFQSFEKELNLLINKFETADSDRGISYNLNISLYPDSALTSTKKRKTQSQIQRP